MSYQSNSERIYKRTAFYDNTLFYLQKATSDIKTELASRWCTEKDTDVMNTILEYLRLSEIALSMRYQEVLSERIEDLRNSTYAIVLTQ